MVDFLYLGEANVNQERLDDFLALAEELKLKGLTGRNEANDENHVKPSSIRNQIWRRKDIYINQKLQGSLLPTQISDLKK